MKKRTTWNVNNPIFIFNKHVHDNKKVLRQLSREQLRERAKKAGVPNWETTKHGSLLRNCLAIIANHFKAEWKQKYGWDLDDARDKEKLQGHLAKLKRDKQLGMNQALSNAMKPFVDKEKNAELDTEMRQAAYEVAKEYNSTNIPRTEALHAIVESLKNKTEDAEVEEEVVEEVTPEKISWQKAKKLFGPGWYGNERYHSAKATGSGETEDGVKLTYENKKWYLHT